MTRDHVGKQMPYMGNSSYSAVHFLEPASILVVRTNIKCCLKYESSTQHTVITGRCLAKKVTEGWGRRLRLSCCCTTGERGGVCGFSTCHSRR